MRIVLNVPMPTPSLNEFAYSSHWKVKSIQTKWRNMLWAVAGGSSKIEDMRATRMRGVTIIRHGKRELDMDNLYGGSKPVIDAIRSLGLIVNDDKQSIVLQVKQEKPPPKTPASTTIIIEDLP